MKIKGFRIDKMPFIGFPEEGGGVHDKYSINSLFIIYKHSLMSIKSPKKNVIFQQPHGPLGLMYHM